VATVKLHLQAQAWAAAERSLTSRLRDAEANAAAAAAREAAAQEALGALQVSQAAACSNMLFMCSWTVPALQEWYMTMLFCLASCS
jgi:hypothetical protein